MLRVPFFSITACRLLLAFTLLAAFPAQALCQGDSTEVDDGRFPALTHPQFRLMERTTFPGELIRNATWIDAEHFLCLTAGPEGARVWTVDFEDGDRSLFISPPFFNEHIAGFPDCLNLAWKVSHSAKYLFLHWPDSTGDYHWRLLDISDPPFFISKSFAPPAGMRVNDILFSPDDHYAVFTNDAFSEGSQVSLLVLDLVAGEEAWRLSTHDLSFLRHIWWDDSSTDPACFASADLHNGEFHDSPGLAVLDIAVQELEFDASRRGLLIGDSADWGSVACYRDPDSEDSPFYLRADIDGHGENRQVPLSDEPLQLHCLQETGMVLLRNTVNYTVSQLWLIDLINGDKMLVSGDCERFSAGPDGKLLVIPRGSNEVQIHQFFRPD